MEKTAQQTSEQGTLIAENIDEDGSGPLDFNHGGSDTPQKDSTQMTHGQEGYPGVRPEAVNEKPGENPPAAGDVDPDSSRSATETGQDGNTNDVDKKKAYNYNG